ncbi:hypothetical protein CC80DRAFT_596514 [Byssothecium circinans]|uniref:Glucose-methanol-choline oxidoreductase N-terminal domain-containing protein n=1 Tax=Byssothecium circinans TaxID=147558 RepID=A0A6A5TNM4_9PLEO|nr:hypothetical protein CC80DRAFT_596514 [Byssothecium circinans]
MVLRAVRTNSTITGVETQDNAGARTIYNVKPGGKFILAAGAMSSPRILFRSGIGPKKQIETVRSGNVPITLPEESAWIDSPFSYVKDHAFIMVPFNVTSAIKVMSSEEYLSPSQENIDLFKQASGPLTQPFARFDTFQPVTTTDNKTLIVQAHNLASEGNTITVNFLLTRGTTTVGTLGLTADGNTVWETPSVLQTSLGQRRSGLPPESLRSYSGVAPHKSFKRTN